MNSDFVVKYKVPTDRFILQIILNFFFKQALKVLNGEASFGDLLEKLKANLGNMPSASEILQNLKDDLKK